MRQAAKVELFKNSQSVLDSLHAKFNTATGDTVVGDADWGHLQIDATSLFILQLAQMTAAGTIVIYTMDEVNFIQNLVFYIERAYRTPDYGIWERGDKINHGMPELNSSSIGMAVAALQAINGVNLFGARGGPSSVIHVLPDEITRNYTTLHSALPRESNSKEVDAAVLSIISFPAFAVSDPQLVTKTRNEIIKKLGGNHGFKRFLRDGHQTLLEDTSRLHYNPQELTIFENIECEWPLFYTYLILDGLFRDDAEQVKKYHDLLEPLLVESSTIPKFRDLEGDTNSVKSVGKRGTDSRRRSSVMRRPQGRPPSGTKLVPELYIVPKEDIEAEKANCGTVKRIPNENIPLVWAQSLYILGSLIQDDLLSPAELDPLGRRNLPFRPKQGSEVVVQMVLLAESVELQRKLATFGLETQTLENCAPITISPPSALRDAYSSLGENVKLGLSGRPKRPIGTLGTSKLYKIQGHLYAFLPHFMDNEEFYLIGDNNYLVSVLEQELAFLKNHWWYPGRPTMVLMLTREMLGDFSKDHSEQQRWRYNQRDSKRNLLNFMMSLRDGLCGGVRVRVSRISEIISTSCIESLDFMVSPDSKGEIEDWHNVLKGEWHQKNQKLQSEAEKNGQETVKPKRGRSLVRRRSIGGDQTDDLNSSLKSSFYAEEPESHDTVTDDTGVDDTGTVVDDAGADGTGAHDTGADGTGADDKGADNKGADDKGADDKGADDKDADDKDADDKDADDKGADDKCADDTGVFNLKSNTDVAKTELPSATEDPADLQIRGATSNRAAVRGDLGNMTVYDKNAEQTVIDSRKGSYTFDIVDVAPLLPSTDNVADNPDVAVSAESSGDYFKNESGNALTLNLNDPANVDAACELLMVSTYIFDQIDLLHYLFSCCGLDYRVGSLGTVQSLLEEVYVKAMAMKEWSIVRQVAGLLKKTVYSLSSNVADLLIRGKPIGIGAGSNEYFITSPLSPESLSELIYKHCANDIREAPLVQEILIYLGSIIRSKASVFDGIKRIRTYFFIIAMREEISRLRGCNEEDAIEHMMQLSPYEMKMLLSTILTAGDQTNNSIEFYQQNSSGVNLPSQLEVTTQSGGYNAGNFARIQLTRDNSSVTLKPSFGRGINVVAIDPLDGAIIGPVSFDTHTSTEESYEFVQMVESLDIGSIFVVVVKDDCSECLTEAAKIACESLGSSKIREVQFRDSWCLIGEKGAESGSATEAHIPANQGPTPLLMRTFDLVAKRKLFFESYPQNNQFRMMASGASRSSMPSNGKWLLRRKNDGALNRVPPDFYPKVWKILSKCHGIVIGKEILPRDPTISEKTPEELNFALQVESCLDFIRDPAERQIYVECLSVISRICSKKPETVINEGNLDLTKIIRDAVACFWADWIKNHPDTVLVTDDLSFEKNERLARCFFFDLTQVGKEGTMAFLAKSSVRISFAAGWEESGSLQDEELVGLAA